MVENKKLSYLHKPRGLGSNDAIPSTIVPHSSRRRKSRSYTTMNYEWAVYRSKGKPLGEYRPLPKFEDQVALNRAYFKFSGKVKNKVITELKRTKEATAEARRFERHFFQSVNAALTSLRTNFYVGLSYVLFESYFYKNVLFYWFVWLNFYMQEYVYVNLALYFPILDWFTTNVFFVWPVHLDLYFLRFLFSVFLIFIFIFLYFQYRFKQTSNFDFLVACVHFFVFFGSILGYHFTGAAPFLFFVLAVVIFFFFYNFFYFIPRTLIRHELTPPLLLSAPESKLVLILAAPRYFYPFSPQSAIRTQRRFARFTAFPFTTRIAKVAAHQRFIRAVLQHNYLSSGERLAIMMQPLSSIDRKLSLTDVSFDRFYKFNPYDYYEDLANASFWRFEDYARLLDKRHEEDEYVRQEEYMHMPLSMNNVAFFSAGFRRNAVSLYRNHFTGQFDTFGAGFVPQPPAWQAALLADPYFKLYIWLKNTAPAFGREPFRSHFYNKYLTERSDNAPQPYYFFSVLLRVFYALVEKLFDRITFHYFVVVSVVDVNDLFKVYKQFRRLVFVMPKLTFWPSAVFLKALTKFLLAFECRFTDGSGTIFIFLRANPTIRYELINMLESITDVLRNQVAPEFYTSVRQLYLRTALRCGYRLITALAYSPGWREVGPSAHYSDGAANDKKKL